MEFLKNNLIAIVVSLVTFGALSFATTITRPYGPTDYAGGQKAVGTKVDAEFQNIVTWLNTGNISSINIEAGGVSNENRSDSNFKVTSGSSLYQNTGSIAAIDNLSTVLSTYGRPVLVRLEAANEAFLISSVSTTVGYVTSDDSGGDGSFVAIQRDGSTIALQPIPYAGASNENYSPCSGYTFLDTPSEGEYTYSVSVESNPGITATVAGCRLSVTEF